MLARGVSNRLDSIKKLKSSNSTRIRSRFFSPDVLKLKIDSNLT